MNKFIQLLEEAQQNQSGFSFNPTTNQVNPTHGGYMVSLNGYEEVATAPMVITSGIKYRQQHFDMFRENSNLFIGCWNFDGKFYFDLSEHVQHRDTAMALATQRMQLAIWDCANYEAIYTSVRECECCGNRTTYGYVFQNGDHYTCDDEACRDHVALNKYDTTWDELVSCSEAESEDPFHTSDFYYSEFTHD